MNVTMSQKLSLLQSARSVPAADGGQFELPAALSMSSRIRTGETGASAMCTLNGSSALSIAEMMAAATEIVPPSPTPFTPSGLNGDGLSRNSSSDVSNLQENNF